MRHIRFTRNLLVLGGAIGACAAILGTLPLASAGRDGDPVEELALILKTNVRDPSSKEELSARESAIKKQIDALRTVGDMRRALALPAPSWKDTDPEPAIAEVDRRQREALATRLEAAVRKRLSEGDAGTRQATAVLIGEMGVSVRAVGSKGNYARVFGPDLAKMVREADAAAAIAAARALGKIHPDPAIAAKAVAERLRGGTGAPAAQRAAAETLVNIIRVASQLPVTSTVAEVLADPLDIVRAAEAVVPVAASQLRVADAEVAGRSLETIQLAGMALSDKVRDPKPANELPPSDRKLTPAEQAVVNENRQDVEEERARLLPLATVLDEAAPAVAGKLRAREPDIRLRAARTLEEIGRGWLRLQRRAASAPGGSKEEATRPDAPRRIAARAWAFLVAQRRTDPSLIRLPKGMIAALPALEAALADPDVRVRQAVIDAIESYDAEAGGALQGLVRALADPDRFVRWAAARTLGRVPAATGAAGVPGLARLLGDEDLDVRVAAAMTLERFGPSSAKAIPALSEAIGRGDVEGRAAAIRALVATEKADARAIGALTQQLAHDDARVRRAAAEGLGRFSSDARRAESALKTAFDAAEQALFRALDDEDAEVRRATADALANLLPTPGGR